VSDPAGPTYRFGWDSKLRKTDEFSSVFRFKRVYRGEGLDLHIAPNSLGMSRLGLIVPKKIWVRAVDRNRIKRILREVFRLGRLEWPGLDMIVRVKARRAIEDYRLECDRLMRASQRKRTAVVENNG
jgi:ribonuclease P protein component